MFGLAMNSNCMVIQ